MDVVIVGGGIGGLAAALALHRRGIGVKVLEQAPAFGEVGAGIQLAPNATRVLHGLGLADPLADIAFRPEAIEIRHSASGFTLLRTPLGETARARYGFPYCHVHRSDLHALLADAVREAGIAVRLGAQVAAVLAEGPRPRLVLADGTIIAGDAVIGCDGVRSVIRSALWPDETPRFTGQVAWRALVPAEALPPRLIRPVATIWVGPRRHAVHYYVRGGALVNLVAVTEEDWREESWTRPGDRADLARAFAGWHPALRLLIGEAGAVGKWALFDRAPLARWGQGAVTLLGDAAHPMLPFMAQGAAMAIEDAEALARHLAGPLPVADALAAYEAERRGRTARVQLASRANARRFHLVRPREQIATYGALALAGRLAPGRTLAAQDWLFGGDRHTPAP